MTKASDLKPGRIYSFNYAAPVEMVGKRDGELNPLAGQAVTVSRIVKTTAAGNETYGNVMRKDNPDWQPSADRVAWYHVMPDNDCIVEHNKTADRYLCGIPQGVTSETYFIGRTIATDSQVETIRKFKKSKRDDAPAFVLYKLENIANLRDDTDSALAEETD